jgi:hypothetical protein
LFDPQELRKIRFRTPRTPPFQAIFADANFSTPSRKLLKFMGLCWEERFVSLAIRASKLLAAAILFAAGFLLPSALVSAEEPASSKPEAWLTNYQDALQIARRTGKPLLVVFRCPH